MVTALGSGLCGGEQLEAKWVSAVRVVDRRYRPVQHGEFFGEVVSTACPVGSGKQDLGFPKEAAGVGRSEGFGNRLVLRVANWGIVGAEGSVRISPATVLPGADIWVMPANRLFASPGARYIIRPSATQAAGSAGENPAVVSALDQSSRRSTSTGTRTPAGLRP